MEASFCSTRRKQPSPSPFSAPAGTRDTTKRAGTQAIYKTTPEPATTITHQGDRNIPESPPHKKSCQRWTASAQVQSSAKSGKTTKPSLRGKKKKIDPPLKLVPEPKQIFRDFTFFYIPNSDISPIRRARIRKAREYGVTWSKEFHPHVTHIIVDTGIPYGEVIKFLNLLVIPAGVRMVDELYPLDCIQFGDVLDPDQSTYSVKGQAEALVEQRSQHSTVPPPLDSKAKAKKDRWSYAPTRETTPSSRGSIERCISSREELQIFEKLSPIIPPNNTLDVDLAMQETDLHKKIGPRPREMLGDKGGIFEGDELDKIVQETRRLQHLPFDKDENDKYFSDEDKEGLADSEDEMDESPRPLESRRKTTCNVKFNQQNFSCMSGGTGEVSLNPNARTISVLKEMADHYTQIGDTWRPIAYRKVIATLQRQRTKISTFEEASKLPFVGKRLALKIEEIALTDSLRRLENAKTDPNNKILKKFMGIYGVGLSQASKWLHAGYRTLEDLKVQAQLTDNQLLGIEHYDDFQTRIPRNEVTALGEVVKAAAFEIDPALEIIIGGSYRRGAVDSGDIDCLVTKPNTESSSEIIGILSELVSRLRASNFLVAALSVPRTESGTKWHGCCVLPNSQKAIWRRIDILLVPAAELGAALIYFTGNDIFNRSIRLLARKKGMRLNQRGLYKDVMRDPRGVKITQGKLVEGADEKKIFEALGVPWRPPEQRIC